MSDERAITCGGDASEEAPPEADLPQANLEGEDDSQQHPNQPEAAQIHLQVAQYVSLNLFFQLGTAIDQHSNCDICPAARAGYGVVNIHRWGEHTLIGKGSGYLRGSPTAVAAAGPGPAKPPTQSRTHHPAADTAPPRPCSSVTSILFQSSCHKGV